jgi:hypothetical protein
MQMSKEEDVLSTDFLNSLRRIEKIRKKKSVWYENEEGEIIAKVCSKCGYAKLFESFPKHNTGIGGREASCKVCKANATRGWYEENREAALENDRIYNEIYKDIRAERSRKRYEEKREWILGLGRKWRKNNPDRMSLLYNLRRARVASLPHTLTTEEYDITLEYFGNSCALTGETEDLEKEHAIPISIGHGGTTFENCYPMAGRLNASKYNKNIFEWFEANRQRFELSQDRFDNLIAYLASANAMSVEEYRDHVYWCHANPRSINELEAN